MMKKYFINKEEIQGLIDLNDVETVNFKTTYDEIDPYWMAIVECVRKATSNNTHMIVICSNSKLLPLLTQDSYLKNLTNIFTEFHAKILIFNTKTATTLVPISRELFWIDYFEGQELIIIHKSIFKAILMEKWDPSKKTDLILSELTSNKLLVFPMLTGTPSIESELITKRMIRMNNKAKLMGKI